MSDLLKTLIIFCLLISQASLVKAQQQIFSHKQLISDGRVWDIAFEDLNNDGSTDMVIANWIKPPTIYYNNGTVGFKNFKTLSCSEVEEGSYIGHSVGISDFNKDENNDIFYVFNGRDNLVYMSDNDEFTKVDTINTNNSDGLYISLADVDNDNDIDALITNYKQPNILWTNDGSGNFIKNNTDFGSNGYNAEIGDVNNDGYLDVICSINGAVIVWYNKGHNKYERSNQALGYQNGYGRVKLADMDNDKDLDIVLANRNAGGSVWLNDGSGVFSEKASKLTKSSTMCVGDLDLNGHMDIILGKSIWLNNGNGHFTQHGTLEIEGLIFGLWLNDVDNDGDIDLFYSTSIVENNLVLIKNSTISKDAYFGLTPPGIIPEVFAPGIVSDTSWAEHCQVAISPKGDEIYWSRFTNDVSEQIYFSKFINNKWTNPKLADFIKDDLTHLTGQPTFSPDGNKLFFYSRNRPGGLGYIDAWYVERKDNGWSKPINVGPPFNTEGDDRPPIITNKGNAYTMGRNFAEDKVHYLRFNYTDGKFSSPSKVSTYKDSPYWWPLYVSPDETYIIFPSVTEDGFGRLDLYICFKDENDMWGKPINLGPEINTKVSERFPIVSPDGKYLFFMRHTKSWDIFWVSTDIFDELRKREE